MFECLFDEGLAYLSRDLEILASIPCKQKLRSAYSLKVVPGKYKLKTTERKIFYVIGPTLWDNLSEKLRFPVSTPFWNKPQIFFFRALLATKYSYTILSKHFFKLFFFHLLLLLLLILFFYNMWPRSSYS